MRFLKATIIALLLASPLFAQPVRVVDSTAPLVLLTVDEVDESVLSDGQCVIITSLTVGGVYVYDKDSSAAVDGANVLYGPDQVGRLIRFISADVEADQQIVVGTGVAASDATNLSNAIAALEASGGGEILISGRIVINQTFNITTPISFRGIPGTDPELVMFEDDGVIQWNGSYNPFTESWVSISATTAFQTFVDPPTGTLEEGDWFLVKSDDDITEGYVPNLYTYRAVEMHQVKEIREENVGGKDYVLFDDYIVDPLTTNPVLLKMEVDEGIYIRDLQVTWIGQVATDVTNAALVLKNCANVFIHNIVFKNSSLDLFPTPGSPNEINLQYCGNVDISNCTFENPKESDGEGYRIVVSGACNRILISDCNMVGGRHVFTTGAPTIEVNDVTYRYGTPRNVVLDNVKAVLLGTAATAPTPGALNCFDTHGEGWGVVFQNCVVTMPMDQQTPSYRDDGIDATEYKNNPNEAFQTRSRSTIFKNCTVLGGGRVRGFAIHGDDTVVQNCTIKNTWEGIVINNPGGALSINRAKIIGNAFIDQDGPSIVIEAGSDHYISQNTFTLEGIQTLVGGAANVIQTGVIHIGVDHGDGIRITHNDLDNRGNLHSISGEGFDEDDIQIVGNNMTGYVEGTTCTFNPSDDTVNTGVEHGLKTGVAFQFTTTDTLPAEFSTGVTYYMRVVGPLPSTRFRVATTRDRAFSNFWEPFTTAGSGTHQYDITTDSGFSYGNTNYTNLQSEADSYNWTD